MELSLLREFILRDSSIELSMIFGCQHWRGVSDDRDSSSHLNRHGGKAIKGQPYTVGELKLTKRQSAENTEV
jgi:hypothetical protein